MKKLLMLSGAAMLLAGAVNAQPTPASLKSDIKLEKEVKKNVKKEKKADRKALRKLEGNEASYAAQQAFISDFGNIPGVKWERLDNYDEATFTKDGQKMSAFYDSDGRLVGTTQVKTIADLPAKAQKHITEYFKGYTPVSVIFYDDNENNDTDMILYGNQFDDQDSYFAELQNGNKLIIVQVLTDGEVRYFTRIR